MKKYYLFLMFILYPNISYSKSFSKDLVDLSIINIDELWSNTSGGYRKKTSYIGNTIVGLDISSKLISNIDYGSLYISMNNNRGTPVSQNNLFTYDTISSIENFNATKLYELYYHISYHNFDIKIGKIDFSSLFGYDDKTQNFTNGGMVTSTVMNNNSYYQNNYTPLASPGVYVSYNVKKILFKLGLTSSNPINENYNNQNYMNINYDKYGTKFIINSPFLYYEINYKNDNKNVILGGFYDTGKQPISYTNKKYSGNYGFYLNYNQQILKKKEYNLDLFFRFYIDPMQKYENVFYTIDTGLILSYKKIYLGLSFSDTNGSKYLNYNLTKNISKNHNEYKTELTLNYKINDYFSIQPVIQYIVRPGGRIYNDKLIKNELIFGVRNTFNY